MKKVISISMCLCILISTLTIIQTTASAQNTYKCGDYSYQYDGNYNDVEIVDYSGNATNLIIPSTLDGKKVTKIGYDAFGDCYSLISVTIPNSVTTIDIYAFRNCTSLKSIILPNNITNVYDNAFENTACYNNSANWDGSVFYIDKILISGSKYNPDLGKDIYNVPKNYSIRQGTKIICYEAFEDCKSLTSVTIPDSVTDIGAGAFLGCYNLTIKASCKKRRLINYYFNDDDFKIKYQHESSGKWVFVRKRN